MASWSESDWQALAGQGLVKRTKLRREKEHCQQPLSPPEPEPEPESPNRSLARERALAVIDGMAIFQALRREKRRAVAAALDLVSFPVGARVFSQGDAGDGLYILDSGTVMVKQQTEQIERELVVLGAGEYFGAPYYLHSCPGPLFLPHWH